MVEVPVAHAPKTLLVMALHPAKRLLQCGHRQDYKLLPCSLEGSRLAGVLCHRCFHPARAAAGAHVARDGGVVDEEEAHQDLAAEALRGDVEEYGTRLKACAAYINERHSVDNLCRRLPARLHELNGLEGDRL